MEGLTFALNLRAIRHVRRAPILVVVAMLAAILLPFMRSAAAAELKRVLIINSFGSTAPPFSSQSTAFKSALVAKMGEPVDLDEVSLDMARDDADMQNAIVDYLAKRQTKWRSDIVVPIGAPAASFVAKHRDRLFHNTPIVYAAADRRLLPAGALDGNAAYVGQILNIPGLFEDMLQVAPATKHIEIIVGATPLEHLWEEAFKSAAAPLSGRIKFTYYSDLSFDQMLKRVATLPPDSYVFFLLLLRDVQGVTVSADEALKRLHQVSRAPINSLFAHQLGTGIVGGRLLQSDRLGQVAADAAVRILHGEPASNFPPTVIEPLSPHYDWRELHRWKIDEKLLPPGSTVLFRAPTAWQQYRWWIMGGGSVFVVQALLIAGVVVNRIRRRRAEGSLRESERRFQVMADATPVLIWMSDPDKRWIFLNRAWLDFTGRTMESERGDGWKEGIHPDDLENLWQQYVGSFDARKPFLVQGRLRRKDGEYRWVTASGVPRYDGAGGFLGYIGACVDVTELEEKKRQLYDFEQRVTIAAEAAHLGIWELDVTTKEMWMSDGARQLFHFEPEQAVTYQSFIDCVHPDDRPICETALRRAIETTGADIEFRAMLPAGTIRWITGRARCMAHAAGKCARLVVVSMDVTERKQAEQLFQLATEASPSGIVLVNDHGNIVLVNAHIEHLFGYTRDEVIGKPINVLLPERCKDDDDRLFNTYRAAPVGLTLEGSRESFGRRRDGSEFPMEIGASSIQTPQGVLVLATVVDISFRRAVEEEMRRRREQIELLSRISLLGEMTASIAHELNQPLSAILSNASAGQRFVDRGNMEPETLREILVDVAADARRAHDVIENIRNTIKKGAAVKQRIDLNQAVTSVTHLTQATAAAHRCEVRTALAETLSEVEGDPIQIQQVLINLLNNAFEAMNGILPPDRKVEISTQETASNVSITIRDHGIGIPHEARTRLFEQFFTTKKEGLGMGLAIVRSIIEAHGGTIAAENADDGGTRFRVTLPAVKPATR
jgi:PAS domain S-box-containing protein